MNYVARDPVHLALPPFGYSSFFEGPVDAWGVFMDRFGTVRSNVVVRMNGAWRGDTFVLDEEFRFDDGVPDQRTWLLKDHADGRFTATCDQCAGPIEGRNIANGAHIVYRFRITIRGIAFSVVFDDEVRRLDERRVFNRATMKKFGITIGHFLLIAERRL